MRGHLHKFACDLQIHALHLLQVFQILVENIGDFDIADFDFIFGEEHQDQAERPFKVAELIPVVNHALEMIAWIIHGSSHDDHFAEIRAELGNRHQGIQRLIAAAGRERPAITW